VPDVCGDLLRGVSYSRVNARQRLVAWTRFLALTAAHPDRPFEAATVGRAVSGAGSHAAVTVVRLPRLAPEVAVEQLASLVELFDAGLCEPLPIACKTSAAYAQALRSGSDAVKAATGEWQTEWSFPREDEEPEHELVFGKGLTFEQLLGGTEFDAYARRLWDPVLAWERVEHR
jgi:exodeoxyribonuclease V gamma subunit